MWGGFPQKQTFRRGRHHGQRVLEPLEPRIVLAGDVIIAEFLALNGGGAGALLDEDGDSSDWIELQNISDGPVDITGWRLTDDAADLAKWELPARTLAANERLVVFASGKDRTGAQLHTNFELDGAGEYLALVEADGVIASAFAPSYPDQVQDVSYGFLDFVRTTHPLVTESSSVRALIPQDDALGTTWTSAEFDDSAWPLDDSGTQGTQGVGFDADYTAVLPPPFITAVARGGASTNAAPILVQGGLNEDALSHSDRTHQYNGFDVFNTIASLGLFGADYVRTANDDRNVADFSLTLNFNGTVDLYLFIDDRVGDNSNANPPTLGALMPWVAALGFVDTGLNIGLDEGGDGVGPGAGINQFGSIYKKSGVSGSIVLGAQNDGTARNMYGVAALRTSGAGSSIFATEIGTDVQSIMYQENASAYVRSTFAYPGGGELEELQLRVQYDDGFVAYLNGTEVARRNAPGSAGVAPAYDATATATRPDNIAVVHEEIDLTAFGNMLFSDSPNVLAIHALNESATDTDFLIGVELSAITTESAGSVQYFTTPTPGLPNSAGTLGFVADTKFDGIETEPGVFHEAGYYGAPFHVALSTATPDAEIRYTTNGSPPTASTGTVYTAPILISNTTTLRVAAFKPGFQATDVDTQTYIFASGVLQQSGLGLPPTASWGHLGPDWAVDPDIVNAANAADRFTANDLLAVPTISLAMNWNDMFGTGGQGIYIAGAGSERAASIELIQNDGTEGFSINGSVEIQGGTSDDRWKDDKLSMQLKFKQPYGPTKLNYDLFGDTPSGDDATESFDTLILDGVLNWSWVHTTDANQRANAKYIQDQFMADLQNAAGGFAPHGRYVHLYINGLYWGMYYLHERPDETFNSDYQGGDKDEWNVIKHNPTTIVNNALTNPAGQTATTDYNQLLSLANADLTVPANFEAVAAKLDIENFIDYLLINWYAGNDDWPQKNWYASRQASPEGKWRFHSWDAEHVLKSATVNRVGQSPNGLHDRLALNPTYRQMLGDRARQHFFGNGLLTPASTAAMYQARMAEVDAAIRGESARWGDNSATTPYTRSNWIATQNGLLTSYFPTRTATVLGQLRSAGLYPSIDAANLGSAPGEVTAGFGLSLSDPNIPAGTIYYTLDGSEPSAQATVNSTVLLAERSPARAFVPSTTNGGSTLGTTWTQPGFTGDTAWASGNAGVGYDTNTTVNFNPLIGINVQSQMLNLATSVYVRTKFNVADPDAFNSLSLQMKYDDGFVAYLNGTEVARANLTGTPAWNSQASAQNGDANALVFQSFDITAHLGRLVEGENVLAIHGLNAGNTSSDLLMLPQIVAATVSGSGVGPTAIPYSGPITIDATTTVKARVRRGTVWSALTEGFYSVDVPIRVSELHYNPPGSSELTEFVELENISANAIDLTGVRFTAGISYEFLPTDTVRTIAPGGRIVLAHDLAAFAAAYPDVPASVIADRPFGGSLDNGGEPLELTDAGGAVILAFRYDDAWHPMSDGDGYSLVRTDTAGAKADWNLSTGWRTSSQIGGSPGSGDTLFGDLDGDFRVGLADLAILQGNLGVASGATYALGDLTGDGAVNRADVAALAGLFGTSAATSGSAPAAAMVTRARRPDHDADAATIHVRAFPRRLGRVHGGEAAVTQIHDAVFAESMANKDSFLAASRTRRSRMRSL